MEEKSSSSSKKDSASDEKNSEGTTQKITNFFPLLKTEGRAKMCAMKSDDSKQKEMLKKMKGKESMTLRSKRLDRLSEKSNDSTSSQPREKIRSTTVVSALKTPLSQVLRKSIDSSDKKEAVGKMNSTKVPESSTKAPTGETKKNLSDGESGRLLRQKSTVSEKPVRAYKKRTTETNQAATGSDKVKSESGLNPEVSREKVKNRGRSARVANASEKSDLAVEESKSDSTMLPSNISQIGGKVRRYRKRHFRGSTYGLYLTPARKKKKKMNSSLDASKDDECSVTSTENNSVLDSEDGNSMVSEDCFTPSEKSLVDEEHGLESQSSSLLGAEIKTEKSESNLPEKSESLIPKKETPEQQQEQKIEISPDYEENTQNVSDLFQDLEEMQWESNQKAGVADKTNTSQSSKVPQYDDISSESFTNALHFSFKKSSEESRENDARDDLTMLEKPEEQRPASLNDNCDTASKSNEKMDLPETSETSFSIDNVSGVFSMKDDSNVDPKDNSNADTTDVGMKEDSNVDEKEDSNVDMKEDSNVDVKEDSDLDMKDDSNVGMKDESNPGVKDDNLNADPKEDSNIVTSESKVDLNLTTSNMSEMKDDSKISSSDILSNKEDLNLLFEDKDDSSLMPSNKTETNGAKLNSSELQAKGIFNLSSEVFGKSRDDSNQMSCDITENASAIDAAETEEINNSESLLNCEAKQDSNSFSYGDINKQDSSSFNFEDKNKADSCSIASDNENSKNESNSFIFEDKNKADSGSVEFENQSSKNGSNFATFEDLSSKQNSNSITFSNKSRQDSPFDAYRVEGKQSSDSPFTDKKDRVDFPEFENSEKHNSPFSHVAENQPDDMDEDDKKNYETRIVVDKENDDDDDQSTIANCVKSRQRIKRRFTDDIVDTDLGILSAAAMASVKKALIKPDSPRDIIENFQTVTRSEVKKSGPPAKIECVFNYKQSPIKSCTCEGDIFQSKMIPKPIESAFCQAVDAIDDKLLGCTNPVVTSRFVRPSVKHAFSVMCETHLWRLKHHHACPYCGLFCSQGSFIRCTNTTSPQSAHLFHEQCQTKEEGAVPFCFHCGSSSTLKRVTLELRMASPPAFFLNQASKVSVPDVSKARISFSETADFCKKDDDEPSVSLKIEDSGKILSSAGLPNSSSKEELEKLISMLNDDKTQPCSFASDEFYDLAAAGDVLKVLYMLVKGFDPNQRFASHEGESALHAAAAHGHATVVHLLIQAGAVVDSLNERMYTPLMLAVENGHKEVVHYLVKKGAITDFKGENGMASLHLAAKGGNLDVLKILMSSRDTDIDAQDDGGWTPIVWASEHDHLNVVKYLLKCGANPNIRDNEGNIGLHWSAFSGSVEISYLYLDYGCDINSVNELGDTPLHIAARQDSFPCVTLFLSRGADVTILNKAEKLPAECCIDKNSDTYLSLSLNMLLKKITKKYQHKAEKIIHRDISRGKEQIAIQCVNAVDDEQPPLDFLYVTENCETMPIKIDRTITSLQACHCEDDCSTASCSCASISYQCWYDKEGLLLPEFNLLDPPMLFECNRACSCWSLNCHNRVLQNGITCRLQLIRTKGKGWGVRALKDIPRGAFICEYVGELISDSAADKRADDSYLFDLDNRDGETYCLDARYYGNISRFINHLCDPNLVPVKIYVDHQDLNFPRIAFFSSRDIKQYEELGFDYGEKFWAIKYKFFTCECGTPKCKYSKDTIHITLANYYRRLKEEQMDEVGTTQQPAEVTVT